MSQGGKPLGGLPVSTIILGLTFLFPLSVLTTKWMVPGDEGQFLLVLPASLRCWERG